MLSRHILNTMLKLAPTVSGQTARISKLNRVISLRLSRLNRLVSVCLTLLLAASRFAITIFLHLNLVINGDKHGYSLIRMVRHSIRMFILKTSNLIDLLSLL